MAKSVYTTNTSPRIRYNRSRFDLSYSHKTTFNMGDLVPFHVQEILPGDTFKVRTDFALRTMTPFIRVPMDNLFIDIFYFFVPNRLTYSNWAEVLGENKNGYWAPPTLPEVPTVYGWEESLEEVSDEDKLNFAKSIGMYLGAAPESQQMQYSDLPFRAYALIYNEWFRDQNLQEPINVNLGDEESSIFLNLDEFSPTNYHGLCAKINKVADYFTSCLPAPQKGIGVNIPIGSIPVVPSQDSLPNNVLDQFSMGYNFYDPLGDLTGSNYDLGVASNGLLVGAEGFSADGGAPIISNLVANALVPGASIGNINDLRFAFQLQRMLEKDARGGTRYREYVETHFGVINPDARVQVPEYLGGTRIPLSMQQVTQTSQSSEDSPLGQISAYSLTNGTAGFSKGFTEHGFVIGLMAVRQKHTYQQGVERFWSRKKKTDFYDPVFANIGDQPVYTAEIDAGVVDTFDEVVFGYNESWADYRFRFNKITGFINSGLKTGFDVWHFGDYYEGDSPIVISNEFIKETSAYLDRCLSVPSTTCPNFVIDILNRQSAIRVLPTYGIPGLADHH